MRVEELLECGINAIITYDSHPCVLREIRKFHDTVDSIVILVIYRDANNIGVGVRVVPRSEFHLFGDISSDRDWVNEKLRFVKREIITHLNGSPEPVGEG